MTSAKNVLIAGCGYVGSALGMRLCESGIKVWGLCRRSSGLPQSIIPCPADLLDPASLTEFPVGFDYVFYTASADEQSDTAYRAAYVTGMRNLIGALVSQGQTPRRLFFTSSTAVYAQSAGEWVDETSPTEPSHFTGKRMLEAERVVGEGPFPGTVLRLGGIYGPGRSYTIEGVRSGRSTYSSTRPQYMNHIHRDDCAGALLHLMSIASPEALYVGVDHAPALRGEVLSWLAERLGVPGPSPAENGVLSPQRSNKRCSSARLSASGYHFKYPTYREGYESLILSGA